MVEHNENNMLNKLIESSIEKIDDKIIATAVTKHCFTNAEGLPLRLNRINPGLDQMLKEKIGKEEI